MSDRIVLGIHSNIAPDGDAGLTDGHAWISVTQGGKTQTYGLWPDGHPYIRQQGLDNGEGSDIRTGIESGIGREPAASRYYELTPEQFRRLQTELGRDVDWAYTNTCASWSPRAGRTPCVPMKSRIVRVHLLCRTSGSTSTGTLSPVSCEHALRKA